MAIKRRPTQKERRQRAWGAYLDLVDTADWMRGRLRTFLSTFGLTTEEFHLLVLLYREGPLKLTDAAKKSERSRQNTFRTIRHAEEFGWVRWQVKRVTAAEAKRDGLAKDRRGGGNHGPRVGVASLTAQGEKLIGGVLPKQEKVVDALMRGLDGREQLTLSQICRKLRRGDALRTVRFASALIRAHEGGERDQESVEVAELSRGK